MKGVIALALAGLILYGAPALAVDAGGVEGLRLNEDEGGLYLGPHSARPSVADEPDYMNDLNYIWPDVRDGAVEAIETSPEPEFEAEK
jgi:hypothetical protein